MLIVFSTWRGLFTVNLLFLTLQSTLTFMSTEMFWDAWEKMYDVEDRNFVWHPKGIASGTQQH
jgi:hypothetical protein